MAHFMYTGVILTNTLDKHDTFIQTALKNNINLVHSSKVEDFIYEVHSIKPSFIIINKPIDECVYNILKSISENSKILVIDDYSLDNQAVSKCEALEYIMSLKPHYNNLLKEEELNQETLEELYLLTNKTLYSLGFYPGNLGVKYFTELILMLLESDRKKQYITKVCYPCIAQNHNKSIDSIEIAIRRCVDYTWYENKDEWLEYFEIDWLKKHYKPKIKEVVCAITDKIKEEYLKNKLKKNLNRSTLIKD